MAIWIATALILLLISLGVILLYAAILDIAGLVRGDLGAQSQMQQRRYDDVVGICERIEAILEARQIGVLKFHVAKGEMREHRPHNTKSCTCGGNGEPFCSQCERILGRKGEKQSASRSS